MTGKDNGALKNLWWGYKHINGSYHAKRYFGLQDLREAFDSGFVMRVTFHPFLATDHNDALKKVEIILDYT